MSNASRLSQLQDRLGTRESRLHISEIVEEIPAPEYDSVGLELKAHRERKGHELEMAGRVLRIKPKHLEAIEEGRFGELPGKTYAIGFVRSYAEHLGLDPDDCIRRFKLEYAALLEPQPEEGAPASTPQLSFPEAREEVRLPHGSIIVLAGILVLAVWGGWYLTTSAERAFTETETVSLPPSNLPTPEDAEAMLRAAQNNGAARETAATPVAQSEDQPATAEVETVATASVPDESVSTTFAPSDQDTGSVAAEAGERTPSTQAEQLVAALTGTGQEATVADAVEEEVAPIEISAAPQVQPSVSGPREAQVFGFQNHNARVILRARGSTWVRVEDPNGAVLFEQTLQQGDSYRVPNIQGLIMATRNAGAVEVLLDGESLGPAGAVGQALLETSLDAQTLAMLNP